jgi:hypothetical protein
MSLACLLCLALPVFAKDQPELHTVKVLSQEIGVADNGIAVMPVGTMLAGIPIRRRSNIVVVETSRYRLTWSELGNKFVVLPVNGTIQCYQDGGWYIVRDSAGKKHKFGLVHTKVLPTAAEK